MLFCNTLVSWKLIEEKDFKCHQSCQNFTGSKKKSILYIHKPITI